MRLKSARGNVKGNKRPDLELHPREQDQRSRPIDGGGILAIRVLAPNTTNLLISGSQVRVLVRPPAMLVRRVRQRAGRHDLIASRRLQCLSVDNFYFRLSQTKNVQTSHAPELPS